MESYTFEFKLSKAIKDFFFTLVFCAFIAVFLHFVDVGKPLRITLIISYSIGICIHLAIVSTLFSIKPKGKETVWVIVVLGAVLGNIVGLSLGVFLADTLLGSDIGFQQATFLKNATYGVVFGAAISFFFWSRGRLSTTKVQIQEEKIKRISSEKAAMEAHLRLLQAQIEPHFLFNTLSNIYSLMDSDPARAKAMLLDLNHYLRNTLKQTREEETTLGREMEVVSAYLKIFKIRLGDRLQYSVALPQALDKVPFPPMLLQPLVENAVIHGIEPSENGGRITIRAQQTNGMLRVEVTDTGNGFSGSPGSGVGITNVRERLQLLFGKGACLSLNENQPRGVTAVIEIPDENSL
jgi:sensor histidine kinase YesM